MKSLLVLMLVASVLVLQSKAQDATKWPQDAACKALNGVCTDSASCSAAGKAVHGSGTDASTSQCTSSPANIQCCY